MFSYLAARTQLDTMKGVLADCESVPCVLSRGLTTFNENTNDSHPKWPISNVEQKEKSVPGLKSTEGLQDFLPLWCQATDEKKHISLLTTQGNLVVHTLSTAQSCDKIPSGMREIILWAKAVDG